MMDRVSWITVIKIDYPMPRLRKIIELKKPGYLHYMAYSFFILSSNIDIHVHFGVYADNYIYMCISI